MKIWKTVGCLLLLCVIVCGCVVMGKNTTASAALQENEKTDATESDGAEGTSPAPNAGATDPETETQESVAAGKAYSEGLYFRSNGDGTCALAGIGSCTAACILIPPQSPAGDKVVEILPYALAGSIVGAVEIPTTVTSVSAASFAGCERLAYVRVAAGNEALLESDGVLYSGDGGTLLYCPAGRSARELSLHPALKRIAAGAFAACAALDTVRFAGTTAQWHGIVIGDENNALYAARLVFGGS